MIFDVREPLLGFTLTDISGRTILYGLDAKIRTRLNALYAVAMLLWAAR
jgi:hypothetical protein